MRIPPDAIDVYVRKKNSSCDRGRADSADSSENFGRRLRPADCERTGIPKYEPSKSVRKTQVLLGSGSLAEKEAVYREKLRAMPLWRGVVLPTFIGERRKHHRKDRSHSSIIAALSSSISADDKKNALGPQSGNDGIVNVILDGVGVALHECVDRYPFVWVKRSNMIFHFLSLLTVGWLRSMFPLVDKNKTKNAKSGRYGDGD